MGCGRRGSEMNWEIVIDIYTLPCVKKEITEGQDIPHIVQEIILQVVLTFHIHEKLVRKRECSQITEKDKQKN